MAGRSLASLASVALCLSTALSSSIADRNAAADAAPRLPNVLEARAEATPPCFRFNTTLEPGICSECKASPHTLALNVKAYDYEEAVTIVGKTKGQSINCDRTWLKTTDGCWVTQWDLSIPSPNTTTSNLCREDAPNLKITRRYATTKYKSECYDNAYRATESDQRKKMFKQGVDLTLICKSTEFYKTTDDCFVEAQMLDGPEDAEGLPDCGPQVLLREPKMRQPDPEDKQCPSAVNTNDQAANTTTSAPPASAKELVSRLERQIARLVADTADKKPKSSTPPKAVPSLHYLVNTTIGEDWAPCLGCPEDGCRPKKIYPFGTTVTIQCYTGTFLLTTEFCYLNNTLVDYQVTAGYMYPACDDFTDTGR